MLSLLAILSISSQLNAQRIEFNFTNGTNLAYEIDDVRKITFGTDVMNLHLWDGTVYTWNLNSIGHFEYNENALIDEANEWQINTFPNPVENNLQIQFTITKEENISIGLYDMQGKRVLQKPLGQLNSGTYQESMDLNEIQAGIYFCRIEGRKKSVTKKIIKN